MSREPIDILIQQGYMIKEADTRFEGDDWQLPSVIRKAHDIAHKTLIDTFHKRETAHTDSKLRDEHLLNEDFETTHIVNQLSEYVESSNSTTDALDIKTILGDISNLPEEDVEILSLLREITIPKLNTWDNTSKEIPDSMKHDIKAQVEKYSNAINKSSEAKDRLDDKEKHLQKAKQVYERILGRIRSYLYMNLPNWRYDDRLGFYGFTPHRETAANPIPGDITKIEYIITDDSFPEISWQTDDSSKRFELYRATVNNSQSNTLNFEKIIEFDNTSWTDNTVNKDETYAYKVRAVSRWAKGKFSDILNITI